MDTHPTLFITRRGKLHQQKALEAAPAGLEVTMLRNPARDEVLRQIAASEFLISEREGEIGAEIIAAGRNLKLILRLGAQTWDIDLEAAKKAGVAVCYWPVGACIHVAEHILMQALGLSRRLRESMEVMQRAEWQQEPRLCDEDIFAYNWSGRGGIAALWRATFGILGLGEIGSELARRLKGFDCQVLYNKRRRLPEAAEDELAVTYAEWDDLLRQSDIVCCLLPYFEETRRLLDARFFAGLKEGAIFVHCGGSGVVDEDALIEALRSGRLAGAALDTFAWEPPHPDSPLLQMGRDPAWNLILTPHVAAGGFSLDRYGHRSGDYTNIVRYLEGQTLFYRLV